MLFNRTYKATVVFDSGAKHTYKYTAPSDITKEVVQRLKEKVDDTIDRYMTRAEQNDGAYVKVGETHIDLRKVSSIKVDICWF